MAGFEMSSFATEKAPRATDAWGEGEGVFELEILGLGFEIMGFRI